MKTILLVFAAIAISSCTPTENVSRPKVIGLTEWGKVRELTIDSHDYLMFDRGIAHSGTCKRCKEERDSIVNVIINTIKDGWNNNQ